MLPALLAFVFVVVLFMWWRRHRLAKRLASTPLAGYDTGTRYARRHEGRFFRNGRTL